MVLGVAAEVAARLLEAGSRKAFPPSASGLEASVAHHPWKAPLESPRLRAQQALAQQAQVLPVPLPPLQRVSPKLWCPLPRGNSTGDHWLDQSTQPNLVGEAPLPPLLPLLRPLLQVLVPAAGTLAAAADTAGTLEPEIQHSTAAAAAAEVGMLGHCCSNCLHLLVLRSRPKAQRNPKGPVKPPLGSMKVSWLYY